MNRSTLVGIATYLTDQGKLTFTVREMHNAAPAAAEAGYIDPTLIPMNPSYTHQLATQAHHRNNLSRDESVKPMQYFLNP